MAKTLTARIVNGVVQYIIGSKDITKEHCIIVPTCEARNKLGPVDGFVYVEDATKGPYADKTVNKGWAVYIAKTEGIETQWLKVMSQDAVDGVWSAIKDIQEAFATKTFVNWFFKNNAEDHAKYNKWELIIEDIDEKAHSHENRKLLDALGLKFGELAVDGLYVNTGTYLYNPWKIIHGEESEEIVKWCWLDPTNDKSEPVNVDTSIEIAEKFAKTDLATEGRELAVIEKDYSISMFRLVRQPLVEDADAIVLTPIYLGTVGAATSVYQTPVKFWNKLPEPTIEHFRKGLVYLVAPGYGTGIVGHMYRCDSKTDGTGYIWTDVNDIFSSVNADGAKITTCYRKNFNNISITFEDPEDFVDTTNNCTHRWSMTYIVRKYGSAPASKNDGVIVGINTVRNAYKDVPFTDVCPLSEEDIYYGVFSESDLGGSYREPIKEAMRLSVEKAGFPDWKYLSKLQETGYLTKLFSVGDIVVSPNHSLGPIDLKITKIDQETGAVYMTAMNSIGKYVFDCAEDGLLPAISGESWGSYLTWYSKEKISDNIVKYSVASEDEASPFDRGLFKRYAIGIEFNPCSELLTDPPEGVVIDEGELCYKFHGRGAWSIAKDESDPNKPYDINCNLKKWLNSYKDTFNPSTVEKDHEADNLDDNAYPNYGFLSAFESEYFKSMIAEVQLPSKENNGIDVLPNEAVIWSMDSSNESAYEVKCWKLSDAGRDAQIVRPAEEANEVYPVFVLKKH